MDTTTRQARAPEVSAPGTGHHLHFLNHLATVKVAADGTGALSAVEFLAPRGFGPPLHRHEDEDELFVVLDGELAFHHGEDRLIAGAQGVAMLPRGVPHTFQVLSETARFICVTGSSAGVPRFDQMVTVLGVPTDVAALPEPGYIDATVVADICGQHGIEVLGPPPGPLD
jgi:mannose-6-phosphate isomerase-like protein (cupin superfamily)